MKADDHDGNAKLRFGALEAGRGIAASLVVAHHAGNIVQQPRFFGAVPFGNHLGNFNVGVDFFFVLSGFIIAWVHWNDIGRPERVPSYALKRFLRIYPPYWAILLPLTALYLLFPGAGLATQRDPANIVMSFLLLPYPAPPVLGVAWTLVHEMFFYLVFAVIMATGRRALLVLPIWFVAIAVATLLRVETFPLAFFLSPFNMEFILGVGVAALLRVRSLPAPMAFIVAGAGGFAALVLFATDIQGVPLLGRLAFGLTAALFVMGCVERERRRPMRLPKLVALFGAASYAIYLVHPVALSFGVQVLTRLSRGDWFLEGAVMILAAFGIVVGVLFHLAVEKPITRGLKAWRGAGEASRRDARASGRA